MNKRNKKLFLYGALGLICAFAFILRTPSFNSPLDYDVGGHLFYGMEVVKDGFYSTLQEIRPVGILMIFALIYKIFGNSSWWVNVLGASCWIFSTFFLYKIVENFFNSKKLALLSSLIFAFFASSRAIQGEMVNMETFFMTFSLLGFFLFFLGKKKEKNFYFFLSGFSFGVSFLIKHLALFDFIVIFLYELFLIFYPKFNTADLGRSIKKFIIEGILLISGFLAPIFFVSFYFLLLGQFHDFFYYQFTKIYSNTSAHHALGNTFINFKNNFLPILKKTYFFWLLALAGLIDKFFLKREIKRFFLVFWMITVFIGMYYLRWFFPHHFLQLTPPLSIFASLFVSDLYDFGKKGRSQSWLRVKNVTITMIFILGLLLFLKGDSQYFLSYFQRLRGKITKEEHLARVGFDIGPDGWLPLYETADYLKKTTKPEETVFIWGSVTTTYVLAEKQPISWFVYKYPLLPDELRPEGFRKWFPDFKENRKKLMAELSQKFPDYLIIQVWPEKIFDEMISFSDFSKFIFKNYEFKRQIGNILIYKRGNKSDGSYDFANNYKIIPPEIIKRYAIITQIKNKNGTTVNFMPIVNTAGVAKELEAIYPKNIKINLNPIYIQFFGQDGSDFVGNVIEKPSKTADLHIKGRALSGQVSFACLKIDNIIWSNRPYGVNHFLKIVQNGDIFDIYLEPPSDWQNKDYEIYLIYEDGSVSKQKNCFIIPCGRLLFKPQQEDKVDFYFRNC